MPIIQSIKTILGLSRKKPEPEKWVELWDPAMGSNYRDFWDNMAKDKSGAYLAVAGEPFGKPATEESLSAHGQDTAAIIAQVLDVGPADEVLEIGVGVGRIAEHIAPRCRRFTGMDISPNMIRFAAERLKAHKNVVLLDHDKSDLRPFDDASFDKVYLQVVLIHLDREDAFNYMRETARVLKPGGRAWFQFYNLLHPKGFAEFKFAVDFMVDKGGKTRGRVHCYTASEVRKLVTEAGLIIREDLSNLEEKEQTFRYQVPDHDWEYYLIAVAEKRP